MSELTDVTAKAMALSAQERAELAELLIQSLDEQDEDAVKSAWLREISRRDHEIRAGMPVTKPADQVLKAAREQLRCSA